MEKKISLAMMLTVAIASFLTVYWLLEPRRVKVETEGMNAQAAQKGKPLYLTHCARCHGETGGPQKRVKAINSKKYLEAVEDTLLYKIIERGIPRTGMVALGDQEGGPLNREQIHQLVVFIRSWEKTAPLLPDEPSLKERAFFIQEEATYTGSESCIGCHQSLDKKHIDAWRNSSMTKNAFSRIRGEKDKSRCTPCHATGYDPEKRTYKEENVGCEACHGPGEKYQDMMMGKDALEGGKIARENGLKSCTRCHKAHIPKEKHIALAREGLLAYP
ncbi:MAG: multiheme c-type cytochrome [Thermodesulfobacteriota bacterium]|nr:multiheme c-type cytochrome [Thermodesulfobacteriota bacterium]